MAMPSIAGLTGRQKEAILHANVAALTARLRAPADPAGERGIRPEEGEADRWP